MFRRSEKVTVNGFFGAPRSGVVIHPGSWWSGVAHVLFDGDQTVTAVPRRLITREITAKAEDFEQLEKYCNEDVSAEKAFAAQCGSGDPDIHDLPRETVKSPLFAAPYGSQRIDFFLSQFKNRQHVVDMRTGRIMIWLGVRTMPGNALYCEFECRSKILTLPAMVICEALESRRFVMFSSNKKAREAIQAVDIKAHFRPGVFVCFDGSFRLYQVVDFNENGEEAEQFSLALCCEDEEAKPFKTLNFDRLAQCFRSGHTVVYPDYQTAIADLSDKSPMVYFDPSEEEEY